jgi:hypothetical protein
MIRDALRLMAECALELGESLPRPNPKAKDKKAVFTEIIPCGSERKQDTKCEASPADEALGYSRLRHATEETARPARLIPR